MRRYGRILIATLFCWVAVACAANPSASGPRSDDRVITEEEIRQAGARDAYELVERLRPMWLKSRRASREHMPSRIAVFLNSNRLGDLDALRRFGTEALTSVRYLDSAAASAQLPGLGSGHVEGAIILSTRAGAR